ncbi:MAG TPA: hypothetical protein VH559_05350 [Gemmatimonadaceae bacterium]|jgi:hypothetical protein
MSEATIAGTTAQDEFPYPEGRVVAILDTVEHLWDAVEALVTVGFLESEIDVGHGAAAADKIAAGTGRRGLAHVVMKLVAKIGLPHDETAQRQRYEEALRAGQFVLAVETPTEQRKVLASQIIHKAGGRFIHYFGESTFEVMSA